MARRAAIRWSSPPPTSVDEELVAYDDGSVLLAVRGPRGLGPAVGTYRCRLDDDDRRVLEAAGVGPIEFDLRAPVTDAAAAALLAAADRVAATAFEDPVAVATFHTRAGRTVVGSLSVTLFVVASGTRAVEFELDPAASSVHFHADGASLGWAELPTLPIGFVTPLAEGLGGLAQRAIVAPDAYGAITFEIAAPADAAAVSMTVGGWLSEALPDAASPARFIARTANAEIAG